MDSRNIVLQSKRDGLLREVTKMNEKCINEESERISAGADKKHQKKHRKLKYNYVNCKNKKRKKHKHKREEDDDGLRNLQRGQSKFHDMKGKEIPIIDETNDKGVIPDKVATQRRESESSLKIPQMKESPSECSRNDDCTKKMVDKIKTNSNSNKANESNRKVKKHFNKKSVKKGAEEKSGKFAKGAKKESKPAKEFYTKKFAERNSKSASVKGRENMKRLKKEKGKNEKRTEKAPKISEAWEELVKSPSKIKRKNLTVKVKGGNKQSKDLRSASELKKINGKEGKILRNRSNSEKLSGKIRKKKLEREGSKSAEESKTVSESEKKAANKRGKSKTGKKGKHSEAFYEFGMERGKKKVKKGISEQRKMRKHKATTLNGEDIPKGKKDFPYKDELTEVCAQETEVNGQNGIGEKLKRVDAILASRSEKEKRVQSGEKLRIKKREAKAIESHGKENKLSEDLKHRSNEKTVATATSTSTSMNSLASSQMPTSLSITDSQTTAESYAVKSDITKAVKRNEISNDTTDGKEKKEEEDRTLVIMKKPKQVLKEAEVDVSTRKDNVRIQKDPTLPEKGGKYIDGRKIMHVKAFIQQKDKIYDMTTTPERIRAGTSKTEESNSDVDQKADVASTFQLDTPEGMEQSMRTLVTSSEMDSEGRSSLNLEQKYNSNLDQTSVISTEKSHSATSSAELEGSKEPKTKSKKDVLNESGSMNTVSSSMKEQLNELSVIDNDQIENITSSEEFQKKLDMDEMDTESLTNDKQNDKTDDECGRETNLEETNKRYYENEMKNNKLNDRISHESLLKKRKFQQELETTGDSINTTSTTSPTEINVEANKNERKDRSYLDGLVEIRTILEIYGIDEEKKKAFDKLLDEDTPMNDKEIAQSLRKAVCDLPMNTELLEKVLKKMRQNGLLRRKEEKILQKNLVPEAVNESVTIALLAQVLQRQKLNKLISYR